MNDEKLKQLFESARTAKPPLAPEDFDAQVLRAIRNEPREGGLAPVTLWDQLEALFPRLAFASVLVIALCFAGDYAYSVAHPAGLMAEVNDVSEQWLFASSGN